MRELLRAADEVWRALAQRAGLGVAEVVTLELLHFRTPLPSSEIGRRTGLSAPGVTTLIRRFEQRGLARRFRPAHNQRIVLVELTASGRELTEQLFGSLVELVERAAEQADVPEVSVRVQCLHYTAQLLHRAATPDLT